jgi:hypothetical protein
MKHSLYERVVLAQDLTEHGLKRGDVATLVDYVLHPEGGEPGCALEFFNALGESIAVAVVPESHVEPLRADEIFSIRHLQTGIAGV